MGTIEMNHIRQHLEKNFTDLIDMSDYRGPQEGLDAARLSRALAAFAVAEKLHIEPQQAVQCITDGFNDNGLDAIGISEESGLVVVVQSKWRKDGSGAPSLGDIQATAKGVTDLIAPRFELFNEKIQARQQEIQNALDNPDVKFSIVVCHTGNQKLSPNARQPLEQLLADTNDVSDVVGFSEANQGDVHAWVRGQARVEAPTLAATLHHWGIVEEPHRAFYGQVDASEIAEWWTDASESLFDQNIRKFIADSSVNEAIFTTLDESPETFWYMNNGITVLCESVKKSPAGGGARKSGSFVFSGATVVNGAQTVGSIGKAAATNPAAVQDARALVRFISLENCPPDFASTVTRATNTQNRVERRDFVSLDPEQDRLKLGLKLELDKTYVFKTGEKEPSRADGCNIVEATAALACASSPELAVQAKREIGKLWEDTQRPPYKTLFNSGLSATYMWNCIQILRTVEETLSSLRSTNSGRKRSVAVHGNRFITHLVSRRLRDQDLTDQNWEGLTEVPRLTQECFEEVSTRVDELFEGNYLASLFKNVTKCKELAEACEQA